MIVDLFSGIRGWECLTTIKSLGFDNNEEAVATSNLLNHRTVCTDVRNIAFDGVRDLDGLIASPPCGPFSSSGLGKGREDLEKILHVLNQMANGKSYKYTLATIDPDSQLVVEPLRWALHFRPEWIALEQVKEVQPIWNEYESILRSYGYSVATGILGAEQYGLGTTRRRSYLIASRTKDVALPVPTHSSFYPHRPEHLDPNVSKWSSMADVLGWGMTHKPAGTITAGGTKSGGAEPFGNGQRKNMLVEYRNGRWIGPWNPRPSIQDLLLLQGFPEDYPLTGGKTAKVRQVGNAVCPPIGKLLLESLV